MSLDYRVLGALHTLGARGVPPTVREIADELAIKSPSAVHRSLVRLRDAGHVTWTVGSARTLRPVS